jgi:toxin-antitoxin system PIN domain toxin
MATSLVDVKVWLALLVQEHVHHAAAQKWFSTLRRRDAGLCRAVQLGLIRLLGDPRLMKPSPLSALDAWRTIVELPADEQVRFLSEPLGLDSTLPELFRYPVPTRRLVNDAYLAAFAICSDRKVVTLDRGFVQFHGLQVEILSDET